MTNKIAMITDSHAGVRGDSEHFMDYQRKFYEDVFFPKIKEQGVKEVFHLGDFFERRKFISFKTLDWIEECFLIPLQEMGVKFHILIGNHDIYYKNTNKINSVGKLLAKYDNVVVYEKEPVEVPIGDKYSALMVPWINSQNYDDTMAVVQNTKAEICMGHFEFVNFEMHRGEPSHTGMPTSGFDSFHYVFSGHFHTPSRRGNIIYLGAPFEYTWSDYDDPRGFYIMDTDTLQYEHIVNPYTMFYKWIYDDSLTAKEYPAVSEVIKLKDRFEGKYIKVIVKSKTDHYLFDRVLEAIYNHTPYEVQIIENAHIDLSDLSEEQLLESTKDTIAILMDSVDTLSEVTDEVKIKTKDLLKDIYSEALAEA